MTITLDRTTQYALVVEASRAPSVHNIQPARWCFLENGEVLLYEDTRRRLPIADPNGRDNAISLGAAFEGLALALSRRNLTLVLINDDKQHEFHDKAPYLRHIARARLVSAARPDPLADLVHVRRTHRGRFVSIDENARALLGATLTKIGGLIPIVSSNDISEVAQLNDQYGYLALCQPSYQAELYQWMRFRRDRPEWSRDGLNADSLSLNEMERIAAGLLLHPTVFGALRALNLARPLIAESAKTGTAAAIAILLAPKSQTAFETGRQFYRTWLEICRAGYALCPMSVLSDSTECVLALERRWHVPVDREIINVLRIGKVERAPALSPRLPAEELLV